MRARTVAVVGVVAMSGLAVSCIGDSDDVSSAAPETTISATASEFQFEPASWTVPAGEVVTMQFENGGSVAHEWVIIELGQELDSEADFTEDKVLFEIEETQPGTTADQVFTVEEPGSYQVICGIAGHFDAGMEGELTVE
jgi:uncharacterized cupredoxin-like copper-binding protein